MNDNQNTDGLLRLRITGNQGERVFPFEGQNYWKILKQTLENEGFSIITEDFGARVDCLISMGPSRKALREARKNCIPKNRRALVIWEPPVVSRRLHSRIFQNKYGVVAAPNRNWIKTDKSILFSWPQNDFNTNAINAGAWGNRKERIVLIQANKISFHWNEQYTLRRLVIFGSHKHVIDIYGQGWKLRISVLAIAIFTAFAKHPTYQIAKHLRRICSNFSNAMGTIPDKELLSSEYQIALVIENSPDYMSEKLFEAMNAHNLVIYVGDFIKFPANPYGLLNLSPELCLIEEAIALVMSLSVHERYEIMNKQREIIQEFPVFSRNGNPMKELANAICLNFIE